MGIVLLVLVVGLLIGLLLSPEIAVRYVFGSSWVMVLGVLVTILGVWYMIHERKHKRISRWIFFLHLSFVVIFAGALTTHVFGRFGRMSLVVDQQSSTFVNRRQQTENLPFAIHLNALGVSDSLSQDDYICRIGVIEKSNRQNEADKLSVRDFLYPQSSAELPAFFVGEYVQESDKVSATGTISKNQSFYYRGWQFSMVSPQGDGSCELTVAYDPFGYLFSYVGYALLLLAAALYLIFGCSHHSHHHHHHHSHPGSKTAEHMAAQDVRTDVSRPVLVCLGLLWSAGCFAADGVSSKLNIYIMFLLALFSVAAIFCALVMLNGVTALFMSSRKQHAMKHVSNRLLRWAVPLMLLTLVMYAVRNQFILGCFWTWSPREVSALMALILYAAPLHSSSLYFFQLPKFYHAYTIIVFFLTLGLLLFC